MVPGSGLDGQSKNRRHSPFLHYLLVPSSQKISIGNAGNQNHLDLLEMQVTQTTLTSRSGWFWLPVFPIFIIIIAKLETGRWCKNGE